MLSYYNYEHSNEEQTPEQTRLYETCLKGSREEIRNYCRNGDIERQYLRAGMNPMHVVAIAGRADAEAILDIMLQNGFDVNARTKSGDDTVLHLIAEHVAVKEAFPLILKLLEYQPDITLRNRKLRTPYDIALARGEFELAEILDGHMNTEQAREFYIKGIGVLYGRKRERLSARSRRYYQAKLIESVLKSNEDDIAEFLKLGADPNHVNEHKNAAIHYAITHCKLPPERTLFLLIQGGADVNLQDDEGDTALNLVIKSARLRESGQMYTCAELLVKNGALSTFKDLDGNDALNLAKKKHYADIVQLLSGVRPRHIQAPSLPERPEDDDFDHPVPRSHSQLLEMPNSFREPELEPEEEEEEEEEPPPPQRIEPPPRPSPRFVPPPTIREVPIVDDDDDDDEPHPPPNPVVRERPVPQYIMNDILTPRDPPPPPVREDTPPSPPSPRMIQKQKLSPSFSEVTEDYGESQLIRATREGTVKDVKVALRELGADPNMADETGIYPIHHVCIRGHFDNEDDRCEMLRLLIDAEADVNMPTVNSENTALHIAAAKNQDHVAKMLLDTHIYYYNAKNKIGKTAYDVADEEEHQEVMDVIENHRKQVRDRMRKAAKASKFPPVIQRLPNAVHPPPNPVERKRPTPQSHLIRATREGTVNEVKDALDELGAEPNLADETGLYPIHHVCIRGQFDNEEDRCEMLRLLIDAGADVNMPTVNSESTALHVAATNNQDQVAKLLLDTHRCDYNFKNKIGKTAYEVAEEEECQEVMDVIENHRKQVRDRMKKAAKASTCSIL